MSTLGFATMVPEVSELDFATLEEKCGIKFSESDKEDLLHAVNDALVNREFFNKAPVTKVREQLQDIEKNARELAKLLGDRSEKGQVAVDRCWPWWKKMDPSLLVRLLYEIAGNAKAARNLSTKKGRPPEERAYLKPFIPRVATVYDRAGGEKPYCNWDPYLDGYKGKLLDLVCGLLYQGGLCPSRNTVAQLILDYRKK